MEDDDEARLVVAAARGDEGAFRELVDRHYDPCLRYATRMLGNRFDAEDAVQETFVRAYRALPDYEEQGKFGGWLFRILTNRCRSAADGRARRGRRVVRESIPEVRLATEDPSPTPFQREALEEALAALPELLREAFLLKFVDEWTYDEMKDITGATVSALKMRVARAREALREQLVEDDR